MAGSPSAQGETVADPIDLDVVADVLREMHVQLGGFDPAKRAVVAFEILNDDEANIEDVDIAESGIIEAPEQADGLVVLTGDAVELEQTGDVQSVHQLLAVLRDGREVGVFTIGDDEALYVWTSDSTDPNVEALRPRDRAANSARRALGQASYLGDTEIPIADILGRLWLLHIAQAALPLFDERDDAEPVAVEEILDDALDGPFRGLMHGPEYPDDPVEAARVWGEQVDWEALRSLAADGGLDVGPYTFNAQHAAWLDAAGFAQHLDQTIMTAPEILASLEHMGGPAMVEFALGELKRRGWLSTGIKAAAEDQEQASTDG